MNHVRRPTTMECHTYNIAFAFLPHSDPLTVYLDQGGPLAPLADQIPGRSPMERTTCLVFNHSRRQGVLECAAAPRADPTFSWDFRNNDAFWSASLL
ncbi:hypothetical protein JX265_011714 [Neoarthrinium moseri]|uniref:Uncharacterized protein n=1 Tax=Neoarthrinium moseri TaxID=1658444 RepID=A0A9P9WBP7_9PEZI|nr:uncharacterized protein JN550_002017 [Neoarthrinium moseri]KAI1848239.1 hypothetical protein JX266_005952 [Neoarthrinium moseri]KAI1856202.1 hypothetical protein JX265_011714 [Neoarthrinium moseri]KAI1875731.1 hypothetical protein JN550_002017 [Neoarthrinium moseri]